MPHIPHEILEVLLSDPKYAICARALEGECSGNISFEEAIVYAGRQVKELWAIIALCHRHHGIGIWAERGSLLNKRKNEWLALNQASDADLRRFSKAIDYVARRAYLNKLYGIPCAD